MASSSKSYSWQAGHSWEAPTWHDDDAAEDGIDYAKVSQEVAGQELFALLVRLKLQATLSARQCCCIAFWASKAGAVGE
eukprot:7294703-Alexandrium_andersonii.AAC.1